VPDPSVHRVVFEGLEPGGPLLRALELLAVGWDSLVKGGFFAHSNASVGERVFTEGAARERLNQLVPHFTQLERAGLITVERFD